MMPISDQPNIWELGQVLLVDKPLTWTSFDAVKKIRNAVRIKKVGHAGTLDPLATGLLIICTGKATKQIANLMADEKEYTGSITLGATTPSYDAELEVDAHYPTSHITTEMILAAMASMTGDVMQRPPIYSAIKIAGQPAYKAARKGAELEMAARPVHISCFELVEQIGLEISFRVVCSKGTYIRSMAHDLGIALQSGAYLSSLRRTRIGQYMVEDAWQLPDLVVYIKQLALGDTQPDK
jgi:tRNA pseudouridine55 synthase